MESFKIQGTGWVCSVNAILVLFVLKHISFAFAYGEVQVRL